MTRLAVPVPPGLVTLTVTVSSFREKLSREYWKVAESPAAVAIRSTSFPSDEVALYDVSEPAGAFPTMTWSVVERPKSTVVESAVRATFGMPHVTAMDAVRVTVVHGPFTCSVRMSLPTAIAVYVIARDPVPDEGEIGFPSAEVSVQLPLAVTEPVRVSPRVTAAPIVSAAVVGSQAGATVKVT